MFLSKNKNNNVYPCKPQFYYIKMGFKRVKLYRHVFMMDRSKVVFLGVIGRLFSVIVALPG